MAKSKSAEEEGRESASEDLKASFGELGRAIRDAFTSAWSSEERKNFQEELRAGFDHVATELEEAAKNIRESEVGQQMEDKARDMRDDIKSGKVADDLGGAIASALKSARDAVDDMATSFTPINIDADDDDDKA